MRFGVIQVYPKLLKNNQFGPQEKRVLHAVCALFKSKDLIQCFFFVLFFFLIYNLFCVLSFYHQQSTPHLHPWPSLFISCLFYFFFVSHLILSLSLSFLFLCLAQSYLMDPIFSSLISIFCWWESFTGGLAVFDGMIGFGLDGNIVVEFWTLVGVIGLRSFGVSWVSLWRRRSFSFWFFLGNQTRGIWV